MSVGGPHMQHSETHHGHGTENHSVWRAFTAAPIVGIISPGTKPGWPIHPGVPVAPAPLEWSVSVGVQGPPAWAAPALNLTPVWLAPRRPNRVTRADAGTLWSSHPAAHLSLGACVRPAPLVPTSPCEPQSEHS